MRGKIKIAYVFIFGQLINDPLRKWAQANCEICWQWDGDLSTKQVSDGIVVFAEKVPRHNGKCKIILRMQCADFGERRLQLTVDRANNYSIGQR